MGSSRSLRGAGLDQCPLATFAKFRESQPCVPINLCLQARELEELAQIYVARGLPYDLARQASSGAMPCLSQAGTARVWGCDQYSWGPGDACAQLEVCRLGTAQQ